jgi:hypothetical protein
MAASFIKHAGKTKNFLHRLAAVYHRQNLATAFALAYGEPCGGISPLVGVLAQ